MAGYAIGKQAQEKGEWQPLRGARDSLLSAGFAYNCQVTRTRESAVQGCKPGDNHRGADAPHFSKEKG